MTKRGFGGKVCRCVCIMILALGATTHAVSRGSIEITGTVKERLEVTVDPQGKIKIETNTQDTYKVTHVSETTIQLANL